MPSHGWSFRPLNTYAFVDPSQRKQIFISLVFFYKSSLEVFAFLLNFFGLCFKDI